MNESYVECLVEGKSNIFARLGVTVLILLSAFSFLLVLMTGSAVPFILTVATGVGAYFLNYQVQVEYEYLYLDREITIDKVMAKTKRKRIAVYSVEKIEILAPFKSYHLDDFKNREFTKTKDYSIGVEEQPDLRYVMICEGGEKIIISPSEAFVKAVKNVAPRKVFTE